MRDHYFEIAPFGAIRTASKGESSVVRWFWSGHETARLERLLRQVMTETDPVKCDELAAEIWRVLEERDLLRSVSANQKSPDEHH